MAGIFLFKKRSRYFSEYRLFFLERLVIRRHQMILEKMEMYKRVCSSEELALCKGAICSSEELALCIICAHWRYANARKNRANRHSRLIQELFARF
jgi:hypothetical protein